MPIRRPVQVVVRQDRLVILPEKRVAQSPAGHARTVRLATRTSEAIDEFVSSLWEHMDEWGIAGVGMYWRPVLVLNVHRDGRARASDLKTLLENSGLEVTDKSRGGS